MHRKTNPKNSTRISAISSKTFTNKNYVTKRKILFISSILTKVFALKFKIVHYFILLVFLFLCSQNCWQKSQFIRNSQQERNSTAGVGKIRRVMSNPHSKIDPNMSEY
jgi:TctA family transporter